MTIELRWHDPARTVLTWQFPSHWTWDAFYTALEHANTQVKQVPGAIHILADMRCCETLPTGVITHAANAFTTRPYNLNRIVIVSTNPLLRSIYRSFMSLYSPSFRLDNTLYLVPSYNDALALLDVAPVAGNS